MDLKFIRTLANHFVMAKAVLVEERESKVNTISMKDLKKEMKEKVFNYLLRNRNGYSTFTRLYERLQVDCTEGEFRGILDEGFDDVLPPNVVYERFGDYFGVRVTNEVKHPDIYNKKPVKKIKINGISIFVKPTKPV